MTTTYLRILKFKNDDVLRDFHDNKYYKDHPILQTENRISLSLYNDDMETANPLGLHATGHKLDFFHYVIKNLPLKYNSVLTNCHLLQVYHSLDVKKYGFTHILQPFVDEISRLEIDGMSITVGGRNVNIKVTLGQVSGDNLGMHGLFGFVEGFAGYYPCRLCTIHKNQLQTTFVEDEVLLRSKEMHNDHVESAKVKVNGNNCLGVIGESPLN